MRATRLSERFVKRFPDMQLLLSCAVKVLLNGELVTAIINKIEGESTILCVRTTNFTETEFMYMYRYDFRLHLDRQPEASCC